MLFESPAEGFLGFELVIHSYLNYPFITVCEFLRGVC